jgi:uncharacterized protein YcfJ
MKTTLSLCLALLAAAPLSAQVFRPETVNGALLGGIAGAVIGHNSGSLNHNGWQGAAIGAVAGGLIGSAVAADNDRHDVRVARPSYGSASVYRQPTVVYSAGYSRGYGPYRGHYYGGYYGRPYGYYGYGRPYGYTSYYSPGYSYYDSGYYSGGSAAGNGLVLGAIAGGIIGNNSGSLHHNTWRGAAWGAGIGWLLGSVADANRREVVYQQPVYADQVQPVVQQQAPAQPATQTAAQPQPVTIINNYYGNAAPMGQANSLFGR